MPPVMITCSGVQRTPRAVPRYSATAARSGGYPRGLTSASSDRVARRNRRPAIRVHCATGNASNAGVMARNGRTGGSGTSGQGPSAWPNRESAGALAGTSPGGAPLAGGCSRSSGRTALTRVLRPTFPSRYPWDCNCSKAVTTVPRDTRYRAASSRVAGSRAPRRSRPSRIAARTSLVSY